MDSISRRGELIFARKRKKKCRVFPRLSEVFSRFFLGGGGRVFFGVFRVLGGVFALCGYFSRVTRKEIRPPPFFFFRSGAEQDGGPPTERL